MIIVKKSVETVQVNNSQPATVSPVVVPVTVTGRVTDTTGAPLVGATIANKTTNKSFLTDDKGEFSFNAQTGDQVTVTFIGYQPYTFTVSNSLPFQNIVLHGSSNNLSEVVVSTGYQQIPKERATGSFDLINNSTINQQVGSNILDRINGTASGVLFVNNQNLTDGPSNGIMIRGLSTINGLKDPLIVLDNFPYDGNISNINPNDIADVSILKDAAAASIWGVKAANGVIVITTKKGGLNKPFQVDFNSTFSFTTKPDLMKLRTISSTDFIDLEQYLFQQGFYDPTLTDPNNHTAVSPVVDLLNQQRNGLITASQANSQINAFRNDDIRQQYDKYIYRQAQLQQYALNISGGTEKTAYYLSAGYDKNIDQLSGSNDRVTLRSQNQFKITKKLSISTNIQYTRNNSLSGKPPFGSISVNNALIPYLQLADNNGNPFPIARYFSRAYTDTAGKGKLLDWNYYPLTDWQHSYTQNKTDDISANANIEYSLFKGLKAVAAYNFESQHGQANAMNDISSYSARDLINRFTQINSSTGIVTNVVPVGGVLYTFDNTLQSNNLRAQLNYNAEFGKHAIDAIAGSEIRQTNNNSSNNSFFGYNSNVLTTVPVDAVNAYPTNPYGGFQTIPYSQGLLQTTNRFVSVFANASYTYNERYILSASARRDASNLFGVTTNNKWNPLWSAGAGWIISKESFYHSDLLPFLKLRATYGYNGNTNPAIAALLTFRTSSTRSPTFLNGSIIQNFPNPGLKWETDKTVNFAIDFSTKNNVVSGSIEAYIKNGLDLYGLAPIDPTTGLNGHTTVVRNFASMRGQGVEANVNLKLIDSKFKWNTKVLYNYNFSKATKYYLDTSLRAQSFINGGTQITPVVGQPLYSIVAYKWAGLDNQGNPQGYLNNQVSEDYTNILNATRKEDLIYKPSLPTHYGSLINSFSYKGLTIDINISYRLGYYFAKPTVNYYALINNNGAGIGTSDYAKRWQKPGDEKTTNVPSFLYPDNADRDAFFQEASVNIDKADNIKLQYINLSYDLGRIIKNRSFLKSSHIFFNASNLGILWKANHDGIDPDYLFVPESGKTFAAGFRANF
ncbi:hypothetical protein BEL04_00190 [Mucilaginibacter sp. PPCGB 2223]|nr:hypothetical protein BEL04_00190 [Mucilaginibacter sp. PPCGB 2223]